MLTPLVGLVVKPWANVSLYANYIEGLGIGDIAPQAAANAGEILPPFKSKQIEVGTKVDLGRVAMTFSAFQIDKPFGLLEQRAGEIVFVEGGEQRNRGLEFEVFGEVTPGVRLLGGVTFLDGTLTKTAKSGELGNAPIGVPSVQLNMGAEWDVPYVSGLTWAANVIYTGKQFVDTANLQEIPPWTRLDLGVRYRTTVDGRPVILRAAVENVFDNGYWAGVASFGTLAQGAPRTAKLSLTTNF
jgi:iron complex outermembrane receptor protein